MTTRLLALAQILLLAACCTAAESETAIRLGETKTSRWRIGVVVRAPAGAVTGILATSAVPMDWPEQKVTVVAEEKSANVDRLSYRVLDGGVKQMIVSIGKLAAGEEAAAIVTFEVQKSQILEPLQSAGLTPPKPSRELAKFLLASPYIESADPQVKKLAAEISAGRTAGWEQAAALFDWTRTNVKYEFAEQIKPAVEALRDGVGDCEELSSLFIALCRASKIPARAVWVPGHTYPEFYLQDAQGRGAWFPCQAAGAERQFGSMVEDRPILQKGDNFKIPEERAPQRYAKQFLSAKNAVANPEVKFILERVAE
ncbi:MAG: transglutaminase family protein [Pirellulaceae bacterium]|nr:transglutaminase family protein [Pirellulaceae bacterium]